MIAFNFGISDYNLIILKLFNDTQSKYKCGFSYPIRFFFFHRSTEFEPEVLNIKQKPTPCKAIWHGSIYPVYRMNERKTNNINSVYKFRGLTSWCCCCWCCSIQRALVCVCVAFLSTSDCIHSRYIHIARVRKYFIIFLLSVGFSNTPHRICVETC